MTTVPISVDEESKLAAAFVAELVISRRTIQSYPPGHPSINASLDKVVARLAPLLGGGKTISFGISQAGLMVHNDYLLASNLRLDQYAALLASFGVVSITFEQGLTPEEVLRFNRIISTPRSEIWGAGGIVAALTTAEIDAIKVQAIDPSVFVLREGLDAEDDASADPWEFFVQKLIRGFFSMSKQARVDLLMALPSDLAHELEGALAGVPERATRQTFTLLGDFFAGLANPTRKSALDDRTFNNIFSFIAGLSPQVRHELIITICRSSRSTPTFNERLLKRLPAKELARIMEAVAAQGDTVPQNLLSLMERLSGLRDAPAAMTGAASDNSTGERVALLLRHSDFEKHVPPLFRDDLAATLSMGRLPPKEQDELERLKTTMAEAAVEEKTAAIWARILATLPAAERGEATCRSVNDTIFALLEKRQWPSLTLLCQALADKGLDDRHPVDPLLIQRTLDAAYFLGREWYPGIRTIVTTFGTPFVVPLVDRLCGEEDRSLRRFWFDCLRELGPMVREVALERLDDDRWYVLRNLLVLLREFRDEEVIQRVKQLMKNANPRVRGEALVNLVHYGDAAAARVLLGDLASAEPARVLAAIKIAENCRDGGVAKKLVAIVGADGFKEHTVEMKTAAARALAMSGSAEALPIFGEILRSSSVFSAGKLLAVKEEIVRQLSRYPAALADPLLQEMEKSGTKSVAALAAEILKRTRRGP